MRRALLIFLSLVLALSGWRAVCAEDGFYVVPTMKGNYAPVPKTGLTGTFGTRDDGDLEKGVAWPTPRFIDNKNGTVTDKLTRLIWTKNACAFGQKTWADALSAANSLASGTIAGLTDGSKAGDWRLPNVRELQTLVDYGRSYPAFPAPADFPFTGAQSDRYWSSSSRGMNDPPSAVQAWHVYFGDGSVNSNTGKGNLYYMWCVRGGQ
jgi:hypothetical protein